MQIASYVASRHGYYNGDERITNFTLSLEAMKQDREKRVIAYRIKVNVEGDKEFSVDIPIRQINRNEWLSEVPATVWCSRPREFCLEFRKQLAALERSFSRIQTVTPTPGFYKVDGTWIFACSNGAITVEGFNENLYTEVDGHNFNGKTGIVDEDAERFLRLMLPKMEVFYPIFALNMLSVVRRPFQDAGIDLALTLFLEGRSGSGKTTLAQVIGMFTEASTEGCEGSYHQRRLVSSTEKTANVVDNLAHSRGITFILDDVKRENAQRQREKSRIATDIVIRGVYQGKSTEKTSRKLKESLVETSAIITGEYRETSASQNARMMILNVSDFMQDEGNRSLLSEFQRDPAILSSVMGEFIRWLEYQMGLPSGMERFCGQMWELRRGAWIYENESNGQRLKDSRERLMFVTKLFEMFLEERFSRLEKLNGQFVKAAMRSVEVVIRNTFENLGGIDAVAFCIMKEIMDEIIAEGRIRRADYVRSLRSTGEQLWREEQFCFCREGDDEQDGQVLYIPAIKKSFQKRGEDWEAADDGELLLMDRAGFERMLLHAVKKYIQAGRLAEEDMAKITVPLFGKLRILWVWRRTDGIARYSGKYPVVRYWQESGYNDYGEYKEYRRELTYEETLAFNTGHEIFKAFVGAAHPTDFCPDVLGNERDNVQKTRRSFTSGRYVMKEV